MPTLDELDDDVPPPSPHTADHLYPLETHIASASAWQPERLVITPDLSTRDQAYAHGEWISIDTEHAVPVRQ